MGNKRFKKKEVAFICFSYEDPSMPYRLLFLSNGKIVQLDTPEKFRNYPATDEAANFLKTLQSAR